MTVMTSDDSGRIVELMRAEQLAVSVSHYRGDNKLVTDYVDMKKKPRTPDTLFKNLYARMAENGGVWCSLLTERADVPDLAGLDRLVWTKLEER